jgi:hypothetical protein
MGGLVSEGLVPRRLHLGGTGLISRSAGPGRRWIHWARPLLGSIIFSCLASVDDRSVCIADGIDLERHAGRSSAGNEGSRRRGKSWALDRELGGGYVEGLGCLDSWFAASASILAWAKCPGLGGFESRSRPRSGSIGGLSMRWTGEGPRKRGQERASPLREFQSLKSLEPCAHD